MPEQRLKKTREAYKEKPKHRLGCPALIGKPPGQCTCNKITDHQKDNSQDAK